MAIWLTRDRHCDECGERKRDVERMPDPYVWGLFVEEDIRDLCGDCAGALADAV